MRLFQLSSLAALAFASLAFNAAPAAAGGCGYSCAPPAPVVVYQPSCGCGSSYYYAYAPAYTYPSAYYGDEGYAYAGYGAYGYGAYGYGAYGYGAYRAAVAPYRYVNRFWRPRVYVGPRRAWVR